MEDILTYLVIFGLGFYIGWKINDTFTRITFGKMLEEAGVTNKDLDKFMNHWKPKIEGEYQDVPTGLQSINIKIEQHNGVLYAYTVDNDEFIGQGNTAKELFETFKLKFDNVEFVVSPEHGTQYLKD
jgi:hypothetical protein